MVRRPSRRTPRRTGEVRWSVRQGPFSRAPGPAATDCLASRAPGAECGHGRRALSPHGASIRRFAGVPPDQPGLRGAAGAHRRRLAARPLLEWIHPEDRDELAGRLEREWARASTARDRRRRVGRVRLAGANAGRRGRHPGTALQGGGGGASSRRGDDARPRSTLEETLSAMARIAEAKNPGMRCSILLVDAEGDRITLGAGPSLPPEYNAAVEGLRIGPGVGSCGTAAFWNTPVVVEDIATDPLWRDLREAAALAGVSACWSHPITATNGDVLGAMALYDSQPSRAERAPDGRARDRRAHGRAGGRARPTRGAAPTGDEDGGPGRPGRRHRARLQQPPHDRDGERRAGSHDVAAGHRRGLDAEGDRDRQRQRLRAVQRDAGVCRPRRRLRGDDRVQLPGTRAGRPATGRAVEEGPPGLRARRPAPGAARRPQPAAPGGHEPDHQRRRRDRRCGGPDRRPDHGL